MKASIHNSKERRGEREMKCHSGVRIYQHLSVADVLQGNQWCMCSAVIGWPIRLGNSQATAPTVTKPGEVHEERHHFLKKKTAFPRSE